MSWAQSWPSGRSGSWRGYAWGPGGEAWHGSSPVEGSADSGAAAKDSAPRRGHGGPVEVPRPSEPRDLWAQHGLLPLRGAHAALSPITRCRGSQRLCCPEASRLAEDRNDPRPSLKGEPWEPAHSSDYGLDGPMEKHPEGALLPLGEASLGRPRPGPALQGGAPPGRSGSATAALCPLHHLSPFQAPHTCALVPGRASPRRRPAALSRHPGVPVQTAEAASVPVSHDLWGPRRDSSLRFSPGL